MARYAAGIVCRRVDVGVMGERKDRVMSTSLAVASLLGARSEYVRFVVEASYVAPLYAGYATV
jgi:hypothetical protein